MAKSFCRLAWAPHPPPTHSLVTGGHPTDGRRDGGMDERLRLLDECGHLNGRGCAKRHVCLLA